ISMMITGRFVPMMDLSPCQNQIFQSDLKVWATLSKGKRWEWLFLLRKVQFWTSKSAKPCSKCSKCSSKQNFFKKMKLFLMEREYRYILEKKGKKHYCPSCGKRRYRRFVDLETGDLIPEIYGRCDRE